MVATLQPRGKSVWRGIPHKEGGEPEKGVYSQNKLPETSMLLLDSSIAQVSKPLLFKSVWNCFSVVTTKIILMEPQRKACIPTMHSLIWIVLWCYSYSLEKAEI